MALEDTSTMSLMPLETPVLKVSRPVAACSRCRNAKIKCDGKLPACSSCEKNGRAAECTSTNDQFARGKERSYVSTLETRIDRLQARLEEAQARKPSVVSLPDDDTPVPSRRPSEQIQEPPTPNTSRVLKRKEVTAIDDLVSDFGFLSVNATARDFYGFTTAMSYARLVLSACSKDELPQGTTKALPPRYTATALVQHYLNNVFVLLPVFDEASFYASVDNVYSKGALKASPLDHWMVRLVLATASLSMSQQRGDQRYMEGVGYVCVALEYADQVLHPGNITNVQALVLLTEYAMLDPHHFDSWSLIGAASRAMTDLGLHNDPPKGTPMAKAHLELRRRVFHCVYALDRSTSLVQTRAFSFSDDSARVKMQFTRQPTSAPNSPPVGNGSPSKQWLQSYEQALEYIRLRQLQSTWYTDLFQSGRSRWDDPYPYLWNTCDAMRTWFDNLAPSTTPNMRAFFESDLLYSYVYILSPSPRVPVIVPFAQKLIFEHCIRYADLMLHLISDSGYTAPLTFYDAMRVYMTGRQFLDVLQHNTEMLLNGFVPPHPEVKPTTAPPPPMPVVPPPPGETIRRFNTVRSITCIRQTTDCLARFGIRWGYMSWNQRYQNETAGMLAELNQRLQELDEMNGYRRPSMWQTNSTGSIASSNGSVSYHSPPQAMGHGPTIYEPQYQHEQQHQPPPIRQQSSFQKSSPPPQLQHQSSFQKSSPPPQLRHQSSFHQPNIAPQISPPQFNPQPTMYPPQQYATSHGLPFVQPQSQHRQEYQAFNFNEPTYYSAAISSAPKQQFATWSGYSAAPGVPDTLDQENAVYHHKGRESAIAPDDVLQPTSGTAEFWQLSPPPRDAQARLGPSPGASVPVSQSSAGHARPAASIYPMPSIVLPPTGANPPSSMQYGRRISMQDAALDVLQSTYPLVPVDSTVQIAPPPAPPQMYVGKGKGKVRERSYPAVTPAATERSHSLVAPGFVAGFEAVKGVGYFCVACGVFCPKPYLHRTMPDGGGCVDFGGSIGANENTIPPAATTSQPPEEHHTRPASMSQPPEAIGGTAYAASSGDVFYTSEESRLSGGAGLWF